MEAIIKKWYDTLKEEGKITGLKCANCNAVEFPPVPVCDACGKMDMDWVEMSGEGELLSFSFSPMGIMPYHRKPVTIGFARLKEGCLFASTIINISHKEHEALLQRLQEGPVPIELVVQPMNEDISYPMIQLK